MRVLAVGAHPDDIEILCAGTLLRYKDQGHDVVIAVATNGNQGHVIIPPGELGEVRKQEAKASADLCGAEFIWMDYPDEFIYHDHNTRMAFVELVRQARPDVVITHNPEDYHMDHRIVSELMFVSTFLATVPHVETSSPPAAKIPPVYYMDSLAGAQFVPTEYVDVTDVMERKLEMLSQHESQVKWLQEHDNIDILEFTRAMNRFRGLSSGTKYAEGYRHLDAWGRNPLVRLLP